MLLERRRDALEGLERAAEQLMASPEQVERKGKKEREDGDNTVSIIIMQDTRRTFKTDRTVPTVGEDD